MSGAVTRCPGSLALQECKALNGRLIDFLKRPDSVAKLVTYVTEPASMTAEDKRQFKYPFASCEVGAPARPFVPG